MMTMREVLDTMFALGLQSNDLHTRDAMLALTPEQAVKLEEFVRAEKERRTRMKKEFAELLNSFK